MKIFTALKKIIKSKTMQGIGLLIISGFLPHIDKQFGTEYATSGLQVTLTTLGATWAGIGRMKPIQQFLKVK
jgi:hypothetical protein